VERGRGEDESTYHKSRGRGGGPARKDQTLHRAVCVGLHDGEPTEWHLHRWVRKECAHVGREEREEPRSGGTSCSYSCSGSVAESTGGPPGGGWREDYDAEGGMEVPRVDDDGRTQPVDRPVLRKPEAVSACTALRRSA